MSIDVERDRYMQNMDAAYKEFKKEFIDFICGLPNKYSKKHGILTTGFATVSGFTLMEGAVCELMIGLTGTNGDDLTPIIRELTTVCTRIVQERARDYNRENFND